MTLANVSQLTPQDKLALIKNTYGLMSRVARKCNCDQSLVSRVAHGTNTSKRISKAIDKELAKELRRAEQLTARLQTPPVKEEQVA